MARRRGTTSGPGDWARAYYVQARSDWAAYGRLQRTDLPACHRLHYLQMTLEKLGKAFLIHAGRLDPEQVTSHKAFTTYLQTARYDRPLAAALGLRNRRHSYQSFKNLSAVARAVEGLQPQLAQKGPNVEYPWVDPQGSVQVPANYPFADQDRVYLTKLLTLAEALFQYHEPTFAG